MKVVPLSEEHDRKVFDCGVEPLNNFFKQFAAKHSSISTSKTYVAVDQCNPSIIKGFYTVSAGSVAFNIIPKNLPKHPVPVFHIARLAVDLRQQGQKVGKFLLMDALNRALSVSAQIGIYAIDVIAKDEKAKSFYKKYGFTELLDNQMHLYLPLKLLTQLSS